MKFSSSVSIKSLVYDCNEIELRHLVSDEFAKISERCIQIKDKVRCESINASFGSILRNDITIVTISARKKFDGYNITADTEYKPSVFFWIFFAIDILLIETIIGFILGMGITLGLYYYNKKVVVDEIDKALRNLKNQIE